MIKKMNVLLERLILFLMCLLIILSCSILPVKKFTFSKNMENSRKAVVTITQEAPRNSSSTNIREAIVSTDAPNLEVYKKLFYMKDIVDVSQDHWAFQGLQRLVDDYDVVQVYADNTFRGDRAATRYEVAQLIENALGSMSRITASSASNLIKKEDFEKMDSRMKESFAELPILRGRVDALEARVSTLERHEKR
ncbi:S-layer homology domain-containing protein [Phormidesmis sp. 146-33]